MPETAIDDSVLRRFLGYHMKRAFNVVRTDLERTLKPFDLRMLTFTALVLIVRNPGRSAAQLAAAMDVERPNLVTIIEELERRNLIQRDRAPTDGRVFQLTATPKGGRLCDKALAAVEAHEAQLFAAVGADDRVVAISVLGKVRGVDGEA